MYLKAFHEASGEDSCIWGGDFHTNISKAIWRLRGDVHKRYARRENCCDMFGAERPGLRVVLPRNNPANEKDLAITYGLHVLQDDTSIGASFGGSSDAHDLVVALACFPEKPTDPT